MLPDAADSPPVDTTSFMLAESLEVFSVLSVLQASSPLLAEEISLRQCLTRALNRLEPKACTTFARDRAIRATAICGAMSDLTDRA
jgi:hypothetical protein